jgi:hypothetical protein
MYEQAIQPGNKALAFIDKRLNDDNYRGTESSEHNRYDVQEIYDILTLLDKYAPNLSLLRIRDTDLAKRPANTADEVLYAAFCEDVKKKVGKGTQDSIRKNIFVDVHRMGLINRYDSKKFPIAPFQRGSIKYVSLTEQGKLFIQSSILDRAFQFTRALDQLLGGYAEISLDLLKDEDWGIARITKYEFMFFVSAIDTDTSFNVSMPECVELMKSWNYLARTQQKAAIETLKQKLKPALFTGDKRSKRDWHNWQNKIDQVYHLFKQTPYFDVSGAEKDILTLSTRKVVTKSGEVLDLPKRSIAQKFEYFKQHKVAKTAGYELHHVVPLSWSNSAEQYKMFDTWENMVYIDAFSHARITQNRNRNILMSTDSGNIVLSDFADNHVVLRPQIEILHNAKFEPHMLSHNQDLRTTLNRK